MIKSEYPDMFLDQGVLKKYDIVSVVFKVTIFLFILSTLFDPADKLFGLKIPLFLACWGVGFVVLLTSKNEIMLPVNLLIYVLMMMMLIPLVSITYYYIMNGSEPYAGFLLLKSYLFISFAILIYLTRVDVLRYLSMALTVLAISILLLTAYIIIFSEMYWPIYHFGDRFGIYSIDRGRDYGSGQTFFQMYFVTSSMIVVSIAYYFKKWFSLKDKRFFYSVLIAINICAMFLAGTRNNMIMAIGLPVALILLYSRHRVLISLFLLTIISFLVVLWSRDITALFDPSEASNYTKLTTLNDYYRIFSDFDFMSLLFGNGLGAYEHWTNRGYNFVTELTYLEIFRNFGVLLGGMLLLLMAFPIIYAFILRPSYKDKNIILAYGAYLVMSATNPLFFSSMGMLILSMIIANISIYDSDTKKYSLPIAKKTQYT